MNDFLRRCLFLPEQASSMAVWIDGLHYAVILTTMFGAVLVTAIGGWFLIRYRRKDSLEGVQPRPDPAPVPPLWLESAAIASLVLIFFMFWVIGYWQYIRIRVAPKDSMRIYVTAKQWMWKFAYPQGAHSITTLYVPAERDVELIMTSRDVVHSFYVPEFRLKEDVIPGRYTTMWFRAVRPGHYQILCAEFCGNGHSEMRGEVVAVPPDVFERWLAGQPTSAPVAGQRDESPYVVGLGVPSQELSLSEMGVRIAGEKGCLRCHTLDGSALDGPTWAGLYGATIPVGGGKTVVADEAYLTESMMDPLAKIHEGFPPIMPTYQGVLDPAQVASLVELIRSLRDVPIEPYAVSAQHRVAGQPLSRELRRRPEPAGSMGIAPAQLDNPLPPGAVPPPMRAYPLTPGEPPPSQQGLGPPGYTIMPPHPPENEESGAGEGMKMP